jgi:hypothetical protein
MIPCRHYQQDIRKRINAIPPLGKMAQYVAIPTTSGTGSEVTPFAVVTDEKTGIKYPLADYALVSSIHSSAAVVSQRQLHPELQLAAGECPQIAAFDKDDLGYGCRCLTWLFVMPTWWTTCPKA